MMAYDSSVPYELCTSIANYNSNVAWYSKSWRATGLCAVAAMCKMENEL